MKVPSPQYRAKGILILVLSLAVWTGAPTILQAQTSSNSNQPSASAGDHSTPSDTEGSSVTGPSKDNQSQSADTVSTTVKLRIKVTGNNDKPISNASVYVRFYTSGGFLRHDKLAEMDLKTNQDGTVKVPEIPQGKIMIQIVAPGWHTYGKWYDVTQAEQTISIQLEPPPHWY